jgi:hypothetical protein
MERRVVPSSNGSVTHILSIGDEDTLLRLRTLVLEAAGYEVRSMRSQMVTEEELAIPVDLLILCHTVNIRRAAAIATVARRFHPDVRLLTLTKIESLSSGRSIEHARISTALPDALLAAVSQIAQEPKINQYRVAV